MPRKLSRKKCASAEDEWYIYLNIRGSRNRLESVKDDRRYGLGVIGYVMGKMRL